MAIFKFKETEDGYEVFSGRRSLGRIVGVLEASGRHSFMLGCEDGNARVYRGKVKAAEALYELDRLAREAKRKKWDMQTLILHAWAERPAASYCSLVRSSARRNCEDKILRVGFNLLRSQQHFDHPGPGRDRDKCFAGRN